MCIRDRVSTQSTGNLASGMAREFLLILLALYLGSEADELNEEFLPPTAIKRSAIATQLRREERQLSSVEQFRPRSPTVRPPTSGSAVRKLGSSLEPGPLSRTNPPKLPHSQPISPDHFSWRARPVAQTIASLIGPAETAFAQAEDADADASAREAKAQVVGDVAIELMQLTGMRETGQVAKQQQLARRAKDDFFDAVKSNSNTLTQLAALGKQTRAADKACVTSQLETWNALEEYQSAEVIARDVSWLGYVAKDRMSHTFQRAKDNKSIADYTRFYSSSELKVAINTMNTLAATSDNKIQQAEEAKRAAENADEDNKLLLERKEQQERLNAARIRQMNHEATLARHQAERDAELAAKQEAEMDRDLAGNSTATTDELQREKDQRLLSEVQEAADMASFAAKAAAKQAEANRGQAEEAEAAVMRMDKTIEKKGKLKASAAWALQAENLARDAQLKLSRQADQLYTASKAAHALAHQIKLRSDGELHIGKQAAIGTVKVQTWLKETQADAERQLRETARVQSALQEVQPAYLKALEAEEQAKKQVMLQSNNLNRTAQAMVVSAHALQMAMQARRQAWQASHRAKSGSVEVDAMTNRLTHDALEAADGAARIRSEGERIRDVMETQVEERKQVVAHADELFVAAMLSNDYDAKIAAEHAQLVSGGALGTAQLAFRAAMTVVDAMRSQAAEKSAESEQLNSASLRVENVVELAARALTRSNNANNEMRAVAVADIRVRHLNSLSQEELEAAQREYEVKKQLREEKAKELADVMDDVARKRRFEERANATRAGWSGRVQGADMYANAATEKGLRLLESWKVQVKHAEKLSMAMQRQFDTASEAMRQLDQQFGAVKQLCKNAGLLMLYQLSEMQKKWSLIYLEESKLVAGAWEVSLKSTEKPIKHATEVLAATEKRFQALVDVEDRKAMLADNKRAGLKVRHAATILLQEKRRKERLYAHDQLHLDSKKAHELQAAEDFTENKRRASTMEALQQRVEELWRKKAQVQMWPLGARRGERSAFKRIVAGWDRDGTPLGPGKVDNWLRASLQKLVFPYEAKASHVNHIGQEVLTRELGFLSSEVISRCSAACEPFAELECHEGTVGQACTRGQVFRVRYQYEHTFEAAEADWFVCRCNSGVMQFASSESLSVERCKDELMTLEYSPTETSFQTRLHARELLPESWVRCWGGFRSWLNHQTNFGHSLDLQEADPHMVRHILLNWTNQPSNQLETPFLVLDRLALGRDAEAVFLEVRQLWQTECVGMEGAEGWMARSTMETTPAAHPGSTDSATEFFQMRRSNATSLSAHDWPARAPWFRQLHQQQHGNQDAPVPTV
eukprot:TRINITY_DN2753_c0_g1_i1.p1 TRINITY_DN2753_c0_g1~~TRINITY_DN2753_c0_g1_i1.p1  ORF type:complete len:1327 (-),score=350.02 TRINITY_DN2753_c0_g1_i1:396-4376(-)